MRILRDLYPAFFMFDCSLRTALLSGFRGFSGSFDAALGKIDGFAALRAFMRTVELIRENFDFCATLRTFAGKCAQILERLKARAMLGR